MLIQISPEVNNNKNKKQKCSRIIVLNRISFTPVFGSFLELPGLVNAITNPMFGPMLNL